jgi:hypothetical protein
MMAPLNAEERATLKALVGEEVAREDEAAVDAAYADFRAGMDRLREAFKDKEALDGRH